MKKLLPKSEFARNVLTLMTGTTFAQALPILISPILTRLYTPQDFGVFALYSALVMGLLTLVNLRYELTIVLPERDSQGKMLVKLCQYIAVSISIVFFLALSCGHDYIMMWLKEPLLSPWIYIVAINVLVLGFVNIYQNYLNRKKLYKTMSQSKMIQSGVLSVSQVFLGMAQISGVTGIVLGSFIGQAANVLFLYKKTKRDLDDIPLQRHQIKSLMIEYKKMPLLNGPNAVVDTVRVNGINIILANLFSSGLLGQYALAWRVLQSPLSIINGALSQVYYQQMASMPQSELFRFVKRAIVRSFLIGAVPFSFLFFLAPRIFGFVFGEAWVVAGEVTQLLCPWLFLNLVTSPISTFFIIVQRQGTLFLFACFYMAVPLLMLWCSKHDFMHAMARLSTSMSCLLLVFVGLTLWISYNLREKNA